MMCCIGLFGGLAVGQAMGGPWTVVAPAAGFGAGFLVDMKLMKGMHGHGHSRPPVAAPDPVMPAGADSAAAPPEPPSYAPAQPDKACGRIVSLRG